MAKYWNKPLKNLIRAKRSRNQVMIDRRLRPIRRRTSKWRTQKKWAKGWQQSHRSFPRSIKSRFALHGVKKCPLRNRVRASKWWATHNLITQANLTTIRATASCQVQVAQRSDPMPTLRRSSQLLASPAPSGLKLGPNRRPLEASKPLIAVYWLTLKINLIFNRSRKYGASRISQRNSKIRRECKTVGFRWRCLQRKADRRGRMTRHSELEWQS